MWIIRILRSLKWHFKIWSLFRVRKDQENVIIMLATPTHGNLGDQAIVYAEHQFLAKKIPNKKIIEIPNNYYVSYRHIVKKFVHNDDVIIIDGGGNLGTLWKHEDDKITSIIETFSENKIIVFPQTCFYDGTKEGQLRKEKNRIAYQKASDLTVMLRDRASFDLFQSIFPFVNVVFVPDIVLSLSPAVQQKKRDGIMMCFRQDKEKNVSEISLQKIKDIFKEKKCREFTTIVNHDVGYNTRISELEEKWSELAGAELLICDRLHAMVFALITKTPCICFDNVSKKVSGTYEWIKDVPYICIVNTVDEIEDAIEKLVDMNNYEWNFQYPLEKLYGVEWDSKQ
ncbi:polysaccharide pyruvyl transferase family protein [Massilimicrobiota sp. An105]|uniref:polysaccharide pyruvyl transferase family protein n=1 Tax=Massilimicrobiota sp. An105 TaxID=1965540 RepID=UPI0013022C2B|nr:polysaccharide pyruvyl transferase family protein [Massilimicrobiota sp. An105]